MFYIKKTTMPIRIHIFPWKLSYWKKYFYTRTETVFGAIVFLKKFVKNQSPKIKIKKSIVFVNFIYVILIELIE